MVNLYSIVWLTGYTNILFFLLLLVSCRCVGMWRLTKGLMGSSAYQAFIKYHCIIWYGFIISVLLHAGTIIYLSNFS